MKELPVPLPTPVWRWARVTLRVLLMSVWVSSGFPLPPKNMPVSAFPTISCPCMCVCVWYPATSYSGFILRPRAQRSWESLRIHRHPHQDPGLSLLKTNQWLNLSHETHQSGQPMNFIVVHSNGKTSRLQYASVKPAPSGAVRYGCVLQVVRTKRTAENFACFHECTLYYASKQDDKKKSALYTIQRW